MGSGFISNYTLLLDCHLFTAYPGAYTRNTLVILQTRIITVNKDNFTVDRHIEPDNYIVVWHDTIISCQTQPH